MENAAVVRPVLISSFWESIRGNPFRTFLVCFIGWMLSSMDQALFAYAIPGITREFGIGLDRVGWILSISFAVASVAVVGSGVLTDYIGRKRMFISLLALSAGFVGLHAVAPTLLLLTVFRVLGFAASASLFPIMNAFVVEVAPARYRGVMSGLLQISYPFGWFLGSLVAAPLIAQHGWRYVFYPAFLVVPGALLLGLLLKETRRFHEERRQVQRPRKTAFELPSVAPTKRSLAAHVSELLKREFRRRAGICFVGSFLISLAIGGSSYFLPTFFSQARGMSESDATYITGMSFAIGAIGYALASVVGEFVLTRRNTLILWIWLGATAFLSTVWIARSYWSLVVGFGFSAMFFYGSESIRMPLITELFPTRIRATMAALAGSAAVCTAWFIAPIVITSVLPHLGWTYTFTFFAGVPLIVAGVVYLALENIPSGVEIEDIAA
jgi:putative MFS transporter